MKPILFNAEMVQAFLDGRKTVTRRAVKPHPLWKKPPVPQEEYPGYWGNWDDEKFYKAPYCPGDILYVRETWRIWRAHRYDADAHIEFKAGGEGIVLRFPYGCTDSANRDDYDSFIGKWGVCGGWHPSIHMPREAARIFLRVTDVRVSRLQWCGNMDAKEEGCTCCSQFVRLWNSTIKPRDHDLYSWDANPWVWVVKFVRISGEE